MHAVVVNVTINDRDGALANLNEQIVPQVSGAPGFVAGYWIHLDDTHGTSDVVFETKEQVLAGVPTEGADAPGVTFTRVVVGEVLASA